VALASTLGFSGAAGAGGGFIGFGGSIGPDYEGSDDYEGFPALFGNWTFDNGMFVGLSGTAEAAKTARLKGNLVPSDLSERWQAGPVVQYRRGRKGVDNNRVDDMENIEHTSEAGGFVSYLMDRWKFNLAGVGDLGDVHNGAVVDLKVTYALPINGIWAFTFGASGSYASGNYMDTYFGVSREDSLRSGLDQYGTDGGMKDWGLSASAHYTPWKHWGILASANYFRLVGDADDDSPVVDEGSENQFMGALAATYKF
jgi:outer membrane scaffolding protein for murein synthesis (MipA/OmpV family)